MKENQSKQGQVTVPYDATKLKALVRYMDGKGPTLEENLVATIDHLYSRFVPQNVKEYIDFVSVDEQ